MKILPINNNHKTSFGAKFSTKECNNLIDSALCHDKQAGIQKLYTLLEKLDKMPGKNAELKTWARNNQSDVVGFMSKSDGFGCQIRIDGKLAAEGRDCYEALYSAVTSKRTKDGEKIAMPKSVFDLLWWGNAEKTTKDLMAFFKPTSI